MAFSYNKADCRSFSGFTCVVASSSLGSQCHAVFKATVTKRLPMPERTRKTVIDTRNNSA